MIRLLLVKCHRVTNSHEDEHGSIIIELSVTRESVFHRIPTI